MEIIIQESLDPLCLIVTADWCAICNQIKDKLHTITHNPDIMSRIQFIKAPFDEAQDICKKYKIKAVPAFCFFKNKYYISTHVGVKDISHFEQEFLSKLNSQLLTESPLAWYESWKMGLPSFEETKTWLVLTVKSHLTSVRNCIDFVIERYFS